LTQRSNAMRNSIYFSAILGLISLTIGFVGLFIELSDAKLWLLLGISILVLVTLPLYFTERSRYKKKKASILKKYKGEHPAKDLKKSKNKQTPDYPAFRKQKSGLTWGGGNIHGSSAKRGSKRGFLNH